VSGPILMKFSRLINVLITVIWMISKPEVDFQYGVR